MTDFEALKEYLKEDSYLKEPLAQAVLMVLEKLGVLQHQDVMKAFDIIMERDIGLRVEETQKNDEATYV
ncbi:MAG: hypothetical protein EOM54_11280 [Clostridia bacterium]|nr:hypothetical protein [Clostridia bacterium]